MPPHSLREVKSEQNDRDADLSTKDLEEKEGYDGAQVVFPTIRSGKE